MGYRSRAKGEIQVTPPISWKLLAGSKFNQSDADSSLVFCNYGDYDAVTTIKPRWDDEFKAYWIEDELKEIVRLWGKDRQFSGYIEIQGEGDGIGDIDIWRLCVKNGQVTIITPELVWPEES
jgi:hypothetical protein